MFLTFLIPIVTINSLFFLNVASDGGLKKMFEESGLVPKVVPETPKKLLTVLYKTPGKQRKPLEVKDLTAEEWKSMTTEVILKQEVGQNYGFVVFYYYDTGDTYLCEVCLNIATYIITVDKGHYVNEKQSFLKWERVWKPKIVSYNRTTSNVVVPYDYGKLDCIWLARSRKNNAYIIFAAYAHNQNFSSYERGRMADSLMYDRVGFKLEKFMTKYSLELQEGFAVYCLCNANVYDQIRYYPFIGMCVVITVNLIGGFATLLFTMKENAGD